MVLILTLFVLFALALISGAIFFKGTIKKISLFLTIGFIITPLCFIAFLGLFKSKIQQGYFLSEFGPILILIAPPEDLWVPLASDRLDPNKNKYHFNFVHKYVGNHVVDLSFKKLKTMEIAKNNFEMEYVVFNGERVLLSKKADKGRPYWGRKKSGLTYIVYKVPQELPINTKLSATIKIKGDIATFINSYGATEITIRKGSDE